MQRPAETGIVEFVALMASLSALVAIAIDAMLPVLAEMGHDLGAKDHQSAHLIITLYFIGLTIGQFAFGLLADIYGRRSAMFIGSAIFIIGSIACAFATTLPAMIIARIVQAIGVSGPRIASLAIIRDRYEGTEMARVMSFMLMIFVVVPMFAPLIGQVIAELTHWRHIFTFLTLASAALTLWFYLRQAETLDSRNKLQLSLAILTTNVKVAIKNQTVTAYALGSGIVFGSFVAYISASQTVYQHIYDTGDKFPVYFAFIASFLGFAAYANARLLSRHGLFAVSHYALFSFFLAGVALTAEALLFNGKPPFALMLATIIWSSFSMGFLFGNLTAIAMLPMGNIAGIGAAITNTISGLVSIPVAVFIGNYISESITPIGIGFTVCSAIALLLIAQVKAHSQQYHER